MNDPLRLVSSFLWAFFSRFQGTDLFLEFRPLHPEWMLPILYPDGNPPHWWRSATGSRRYFRPAQIEQAARHCLQCADRLDCYFGVWPRTRRPVTGDDGITRIKIGGTARFIAQAVCIFTDVDGGRDGVEGAIRLLKEAVKRGLPVPHIVVVSGNGIHAYWFFTEAVVLETDEDRRRFKEMLQRLVGFIGGTSPAPHADPSVADIARILRVPCTWNWKDREHPRAVRLLRFQPDLETRPYAWWGSFLPALPAPPERKRSLLAWEDADANAIQKYARWAQRGYPEGNRHRGLVNAATWLARDQKLPADVVEKLISVKANASPGSRRITPEEIKEMCRWAQR